MKRTPLDKSLKKVLILGSGAVRIGQAGEFDYSGSQVLKALNEEGIETILVNPNIATIQTDPQMSDKVYLLPINVKYVEKIIKKERPDGICTSFGGQTGLNVAVELHEAGILKKYNVSYFFTSTELVTKFKAITFLSGRYKDKEGNPLELGYSALSLSQKPSQLTDVTMFTYQADAKRRTAGRLIRTTGANLHYDVGNQPRLRYSRVLAHVATRIFRAYWRECSQVRVCLAPLQAE